MKITRLASRLTIFFLLAAILPLIVSAVAFGLGFAQFSQQTVETRQASVVAVGRAYIENYFSNLFDKLALMAGFADVGNPDWVQSVEIICKRSQESYSSLSVVNLNGDELARFVGCQAVASDQLRNLQSQEAFFRAQRGETFVRNVSFDENNDPISTIAVLAKAKNGQDVVIIAQVDLGTIWAPLNALDIGDDGYLYVVDQRGNLIGYRDPEVIQQEINFASAPSIAPLLVGQPGVVAVNYSGLLGQDVIGSSGLIERINWGLVLEQPAASVFATRDALVVQLLISLVVFAVIAVVVSLFIARTIVNPVEKLVAATKIIAAGDFSAQVVVRSGDEIGELARDFNQMAMQLQGVLSGLEQRVDERTKALTTVSEIGTAASTILEIDKLLQEVVNVSKERFGLYHTHIYLLDESEENLVLASGAGEPGRQMVAQGRSIPLAQEKSLVARAARERQGVTVNDVTQEPDFLPNPLLPDTRSELAVPMMVGEKVIGVFDVQSDVVGRFTEADIAVQITLASQIASAVQNARSYTEVQHSQALLSDALKVARIGNWEYDLEKDLFTFNDHFYSLFRTSVEQVGGYKISSADYARIFVHPEDAALVGAEIQRSIASKERFFQANLEHRIIFADGEIGYITVNINLERDEDGKIIRWYGANQDVTERRQLEEIARERAKREEALNRVTQKIQGTATMAEALQVAARELGHVLGNKSTLVMLDPDAMPEKSLTIQGAADSIPNPETT